jgi:hypothetical protein
VSLFALIRNGMGIMLLFYVPYVLLLSFHEINDEQRLYEIFMMRPTRQRLYDVELTPLRSFKD